ncbi:MAG: TetR/AcrR family transcriptional regulator C-terminal domain-containing protein [Candidatus Binatia bacterium]
MARGAAGRRTPVARRPPGRPRSIDQDKILAAAAQMDAAELSMPALADRMGVSVQALYRHVSGRDEVLKLLNRQALSTMEVPPLDRRHWSDWLLDYARAWRKVLLRCPGSISHVDIGAPGTPTSLDNAERAYEVLVAAGFSDAEAVELFLLLGRLMCGWVTAELEHAAAARDGNPYRRFYEELALRRPDEVPIMRRLSLVWPGPEEVFDEAIRTLLAGVASRRRSRRHSAKPPRVRTIST